MASKTSARCRASILVTIFSHLYSGELTLDAVPGAGIVMPGGLNTYYLDIAPNTEGPLVRFLDSSCQSYINRQIASNHFYRLCHRYKWKTKPHNSKA